MESRVYDQQTTGSAVPPPGATTTTIPDPPPATTNPSQAASRFSRIFSFVTTIFSCLSSPAQDPVDDDVPAETTPTHTEIAADVTSAPQPPSKLSKILGFFRRRGQADAATSEEATDPLLPLTEAHVSSSSSAANRRRFWKIPTLFPSCFGGGGEGDETAVATPPTSTGVFSRVGLFITTKAPNYEAWKEVFNVAKNAINWLISVIFPFFTAKFVVAATTSSLASVLLSKAVSVPEVQLLERAKDISPLVFILLLLGYGVLQVAAAFFVSGKLRFAVELLSISLGVSASGFLVYFVFQMTLVSSLVPSLVQTVVAGVVFLIVFLALKAVDRRVQA